jgi:hypothetical protein
MYTHTTFLQAKNQLAARLRDSSKLFWTDAELGGLIADAMYTWQLLTGYWRDRGVFNTAAGSLFYDLHTVLPALLGMTITTQQAVGAMQYMLLEPATPALWTGTSMFTLADISTALQNRRNQFLVDTESVATAFNMAAAAPPISREQLPDNVINIFRAVWKDVAGLRNSMFENYEYNTTAYDPLWALTPGLPGIFSVLSTPPLVLQVIPPPNDIGSLEFVVVRTPNALDSTNPVDLINLPNNSTWIADWGALADLLLREGEPYDPVRGQYALARYEHGVKVAAEHKHAVQWELQGVPKIPSAVSDYDIYDVDWHNVAPDTPRDLLLIGQNLLAVNPIANGVYSITVDVIRNAPVPTLDTDFIQLGRQDLETILGYAEHTAAFKLGGGEFLATMPLFNSFMKQATAYNSRLSEINNYVLTSMQSLTTAQPTSIPLAELTPDTES